MQKEEKRMRQKNIVAETRKKFDRIYLHELEEGDVFCFTNSEIKKGTINIVLAQDFVLTNLADYKGSISYLKKEYKPKIGKSVEKTMRKTNSNKMVFFINKRKEVRDGQ